MDKNFENKLLIKVCGMSDLSNILELIPLKPDFIGYIYVPESKRFVGRQPENLRPIGEMIRAYSMNTEIVGVFMNQALEVVLEDVKHLDIQTIQLHGNESTDFCKELKKLEYKIIKAFGISEEFDWEQLRDYEGVVDYFLFDTLHAGQSGGTGFTFNWDLLDDYPLNVPFLLSGGLHPMLNRNDFNEIRHPSFCGIDLNSKFELSPGIKNIECLSEFIKDIKDEE